MTSPQFPTGEGPLASLQYPPPQPAIGPALLRSQTHPAHSPGPAYPCCLPPLNVSYLVYSRLQHLVPPRALVQPIGVVCHLRITEIRSSPAPYGLVPPMALDQPIRVVSYHLFPPIPFCQPMVLTGSPGYPNSGLVPPPLIGPAYSPCPAYPHCLSPQNIRHQV